MKYLLFLLLFTSQGAFAKDWFVGEWVFDANMTHRYNPGLTTDGIRSTQAEFDKWAGKVGVTPKRIKGKKAKLGVPYQVVGRSGHSVSIEVKGAVIEIVKAFRPDLRRMNLRCKLTRVSSSVVAFEVPELRTITMYMRRVR